MLQETQDEALRNVELTVYTDRSCINNGTEEARVGSGIWYGNNDPQNTAIRVPGKKQTNQVGELMAILYVIRNTPGNQPLRIMSDSKFVIEGLTTYAQEWEEKDWVRIEHGTLFKCTMAWLRARTATTTLQWVEGHSRIEGNKEADKLAANGTWAKPEREDIDLQIPADTMITGAALTQTSQSLIYHHLTNKKCPDRVTTQ